MADMNFQLVLEAIVKGQGALDKLAKSEEQIAQAAKAANAAQAGGAGKIDAAMTRQAQAMQRAATAAKSLGTGAHAAASASTQQAAAAERVATAEQRAAAATKAHATAATQEAKAAQNAARAQRASAATAIAGAVAHRESRRKFMSEAVSQASPYGYLLGAGAAAAGGAAIGIGAYATYETGKRLAAASLGEAISREVAFAQVQKKVNLEAGQSWGQLDRQIAKVSTTLGQSYQNVAAIFDQGGAAGIAGKDLEAFGMLSAKVAGAWDIESRNAAQMLTEVRAQTGKSIPDLEKFADKVNYLGDISAAAERDIGAMYQRAAAGMAAAGVGEDHSLAMMTALRGVGMQDEVASRFLTFFSGRLRTATSWKEGPIAALKEMGMSAKQIEAGMQSKPMETILKFLDKASHTKNVVGTMKSILGGEWFDEGFRFAQVAPEIIRLLDGLSSGKWKNSMQSAMDIELGTTEAKINRLSASLKDLMATWAKPWAKGTLEPVVEGVTNKVDELRHKAEEAEQAHKKAQDLAAASKPNGRSSDDYARAHKFLPPLGPPAPPGAGLPMFAAAEGTGGIGITPKLDVEQVNRDALAATTKAHDLYGALQSLNTTVTPNVNADATIQKLEAVTKAAQAAATALSNFGAAGAGVRTFQAPGATPSAPGPGLGKQGRISTPAMGVVASRGGLRPTHVAHGGAVYHYAPQVHVAGGVDAQSVKKALREHFHEFARLHDEHNARRRRLSYSDYA